MMKTLLLALLFSLNAFATCNEDYQVINVKTKNKATMLSTTGAGLPPGGLGVYSTAFELARNGATLGTAVLGLGSFGMTTAAPLVTGTSIFNYYMASQYLWVKNILDQSLIGFGQELTEYAQNLSYELRREVTVENLSEVVNAANSRELFCQKDIKLYTPSEFKKYVENNL